MVQSIQVQDFCRDSIHPGRLTWNIQITHLERKMIFQTSIIMFHVNLQGCIVNWFFQKSLRREIPEDATAGKVFFPLVQQTSLCPCLINTIINHVLSVSSLLQIVSKICSWYLIPPQKNTLLETNSSPPKKMVSKFSISFSTPSSGAIFVSFREGKPWNPPKCFHPVEESKRRPFPKPRFFTPPVTVQYNSLPSASKAYPAEGGDGWD